MPQQQTSSQYFKTLSILHTVLITGQVLFAIVSYVVKAKGAIPDNTDLRNIFLYMVAFFVLTGIVAGNAIFKKKITEAKDKNLAEKLSGYRTAMIIRDALLEFPSLFSVIAYLLTGELLFLAATALMITIFIIVRPTKDRVIKTLELSSADVNAINDPEAMVS